MMNDEQSIRVVVADDHSAVRHGVRRIIDAEPDITVVGEADDGQKTLEMLRDLQPDVLLCDFRLPVVNGIEIARRARDYSENTRILLFSAYDDDVFLSEAIAAGVSGYLLKTMDANKLPEAVRRANLGEMVLYPPMAEKLARLLAGRELQLNSALSLTERELEILGLAARGLNNRQIGGNIGLSSRTVEVHFAKIIAKLGVASRVEAVKSAVKRRLVPAP